MLHCTASSSYSLTTPVKLLVVRCAKGSQGDAVLCRNFLLLGVSAVTFPWKSVQYLLQIGITFVEAWVASQNASFNI